MPNIAKIPHVTPKFEPLSRYGNPARYRVLNQDYQVLASSRGYREQGLASWYGTKFHGRRTSSGEPYDMYQMTAAHKSLPLPTYALVTNLDNQQQVIVKINDRGPFHHERLIDLSYTAAARLGVLAKGTARVEVKSIDPRDHNSNALALKTLQALNLQAQPLESPPSHKPIYLQLGAFSHKNHAQDLLRRAQTSLPLSQSLFHLHQRSELYKIYVGPFETEAQALILCKQLCAAKLPKPVFVISESW